MHPKLLKHWHLRKSMETQNSQEPAGIGKSLVCGEANSLPRIIDQANQSLARPNELIGFMRKMMFSWHESTVKIWFSRLSWRLGCSFDFQANVETDHRLQLRVFNQTLHFVLDCKMTTMAALVSNRWWVVVYLLELWKRSLTVWLTLAALSQFFRRKRTSKLNSFLHTLYLHFHQPKWLEHKIFLKSAFKRNSPVPNLLTQAEVCGFIQVG